MAYVQKIIPNQYSLILRDDGSISSIRLHTQQQVHDEDTGEVISDKVVITIIADLGSGSASDPAQLALFQQRVVGLNEEVTP